MDDSRRPRRTWSDLPKELLEIIAASLRTETEVRRFRAVCRSWRSSTAPFEKIPCTPLKLPFLLAGDGASDSKHGGAYFNLTERTVYRVQSPESREPNFWLVKIEESAYGKSRLLNPLSDHQIKIAKVLNTLDLRVSEVCKAYTLQYVNPSKTGLNNEYKYVKKVVVSAGIKNDAYVIMAIDHKNKLWFIKSGGEKWTLLPVFNGSNNFLDVVVHEGRFYAVDEWGVSWAFDEMLNPTNITSPRYYFPSKRHLVELYDGELFLVDEATDKDKRICTCYDRGVGYGCQCRFPRTPVLNTAAEFEISRIDEQKKEWVTPKSKDVIDQIIFAGDDCSFSVSAKEFDGRKGARVFYTDQYIFFRTKEEKKAGSEIHYDNDNAARIDSFVPSNEVKLKFRGLHGHNTGVCHFGTGKIGSLLKFPEYADIFWPPPSWLSWSE